MGVIGKGLSVDRILYYKDVMNGSQPFELTDVLRHGVQDVARLTGKYKMWNMMTGYDNLTGFLFRTPSWPIGGVYFDGIMRTEHVSRIKPTTYPVQTGVQMTDHAIIDPADLTIEIMMSDAETRDFASQDTVTNLCYQAAKMVLGTGAFKELFTKMPGGGQGEGRSAAAWATLRAMQLSRTPITVETRLQTYKNMLITELSAPDDVQTLHALRCQVRLQEIFIAEASEVQVSKRAAATQGASNSGQQPVDVGGDTKQSALKAMVNKGRSILS